MKKKRNYEKDKIESYISVGWLIYRETGLQGKQSTSISFLMNGKNKDDFSVTF